MSPEKTLKSIPFALIFASILLISCSTDSRNRKNSIPSTIELITENGSSLADTVFSSRIADSLAGYVTDTLLVEAVEQPLVTLLLSKPQYISVRYGEFDERIYLSPGSSVQVSINEDNKIDSFSGDLAQENSYLQEIRTNQELKDLGWSTTEESNLDTLKYKLDKYFAAKERILRDYVPDEESTFLKLRLVEQKALNDYAILNFSQIRYERSNAAMHDSITATVLTEDYTQFVEASNLFESDYYRFLLGRYVLNHYLKQDYTESWRDSISVVGYPKMTLEVTHKYYPEDLENWFNFERLYYLITDNDNSNRDRLARNQRLMHEYGQYLTASKYEEIQKIFNDNVKAFSQIAPGELVPSFTMLDQNGETYKLQSKGKVVLYDIWATWCKPCFASFPKVREIEKDYANVLDVISLSFDEDEAVHQESLDRFDIPGKTHIIDTNAFNGEFAKHFKIYGIPAYLLVDEENKILAYGSFEIVEEELKKMK